ncbi:hypothetical protein [Aquipuribacter hungaricus]|uniref:Septum formation-related domain-containing protein n=1 Tax=Aquipuribacter hungaricus TaxID=545624 RepID=A0ABV7WIC2_9MICO
MSTSFDYPPPPSWSPAGAPDAVPAPRPLDAWSVVALVCGVVGLTVVGLVAGVVGLVRTAGGRRRGRGLAVAGLVVSAVVLAGQALLVAAVGPAVVDGLQEGWSGAETEEAAAAPAGGTDPVAADGTGADLGEDTGEDAAGTAGDDPVADDPVAAPSQEPVDGGPVMKTTDELALGDCFDDPETEEFYEIATLPCDVPHDGEVVAELQLEGDSWPGDATVEEDAFDACQRATAAVFEAAGVVPDGGLDYWTFTPTKESWLLYADREVHCLVYHLDGPLEAPLLP